MPWGRRAIEPHVLPEPTVPDQHRPNQGDQLGRRLEDTIRYSVQLHDERPEDQHQDLPLQLDVGQLSHLDHQRPNRREHRLEVRALQASDQSCALHAQG